jgi:hypothetical protein
MNRSGYNYPVIAGLRAGVTRDVDAAMATLSRRLARSFPETNKDKTLMACRCRTSWSGRCAARLYLLLAAVALLFLW